MSKADIPEDKPFADSRKVRGGDGEISVNIPETIARRYGIEPGDEVYWQDDGEDSPRFLP